MGSTNSGLRSTVRSKVMALKYEDVIAKYEPVLGLEVHVELGTESKMFCGCNTVFGAAPNTQTCPVCLGLPGSLPVVNGKAIEYTIAIGLALNCSIAPFSRFARKNYFYPDMPKNFQTSQYDEPICVNGYLDVTIDTEEGPKEFRVEIERVHMEEDTGKSLHMGGATGRIHGADYSLLDYNRAGIPLVEIVTKVITGTGKYAPEVAKAYVSELRDILRGLGVSDVKMEQGSLRCDANVSLRPIGVEKLGTRSETKNVNSLRSVERAVRGEMIRHAELLNNGEKVVQETRHFHEDTGLTTPGRSKEQAEDYRYFPEPDLVPVAPTPELIEKIRASLPEKPSIRRKKLQDAWQVPDKEMAAMINADVLDLVEATVKLGADPTRARSWWLGEIARLANEKGVAAAELPISSADVAEIVVLIEKGELTDKLARQVVEGVIAGEGRPSEIIQSRGIQVVSDDSALMAAIEKAIALQPDVAEKVRGGHVPAAGALIGAVMKETKGQADAAKVRELLLKHLGQA
ncbi:MAG: Asp-tRNA(Asn)/Glu-tRNA(Gln) amidotransferase subunit GatB [Candidatus Nanopelagicaceae bacterium]